MERSPALTEQLMREQEADRDRVYERSEEQRAIVAQQLDSVFETGIVGECIDDLAVIRSKPADLNRQPS
jgi:hypothetical protein